MKNVMFIVSSLAGGGAERVTVNLCNALCGRYNITLVTLFSNPDAYKPDEKVNVIRYTDQIRKLPFPVRKVMKLTGHFPRLMWVAGIKRSLRPGATISMLSVPNVLNSLTGTGDFRIVSERADPEVIGGRYMRCARLSMEGADHVVFQSRRVRDMFPARIQNKSSIILNPVSADVMASDVKEKKIVTAGRLENQKNHNMLIRAFGRFCESHPDHTLEIYGNGSLREELEELADRLRIADRVSIISFTPDWHEKIRNAEMFVLSSDFEGLSNALLEAMMMGVPCISTNCAGSDEVIQDRKNGLLVPVGDETALYEAMKELAEDGELRRNIAEQAVITSERFRTDNVIEQWVKLIDDHI